MSNTKIFKVKIRSHVWRSLEEKGIALPPKPIWGRIPNFINASKAAENIVKTRVYREAKVIKVDPDSSLKNFRFKALLEDKVLVMPTPRIRKGFIILDPNNISHFKIKVSSTIRGAFLYGKIVEDPFTIPKIDLFVVGCVAVSKINGIRLGKGGGYSDLEYAILLESGSITKEIPIIALAHDLQVFDIAFPQEPYDAPVDYIATSTQFIKVINRASRPKGLICELLRGEHRKLNIINKLKKCN